MTPKRTYINLINDFWDRYAQEPLSAPASMVYFYLLNLINRNRWKPVFISDHDLAAGAGVARRALREYKLEIEAAGLLIVEPTGTGRTAGTVYQIPTEETAQKGTINGANLRQFQKRNGAKRNQSKAETAQKGTINGANLRQLTPATPINIYNKTSIRPSTTTEDSAEALNVVVEVEAEEVEILEDKNNSQIAGAADLLEKKKQRAAAQGAEILKSFFAPSNQYALECLQMSCHVSLEQLQDYAREIIAQWIQDGRSHDDYKGNFDLAEGIKHLRMTIPKKAAAAARGQAMPKTREQSRQDLMAGALQNLRNAINREGQPGAPADADPF